MGQGTITVSQVRAVLADARGDQSLIDACNVCLWHADARGNITAHLESVTRVRAVIVARGGYLHGPGPAIMVAQGTNPQYMWRQYFVITDERCVVVEMLPALLGGWKFHSVTVQDGDDWRGCSRDAIVAWKTDKCVNPPTMAPDLGEFHEKLLAVAAAGRLPERAP